jgi:hypothetical protein
MFYRVYKREVIRACASRSATPTLLGVIPRSQELNHNYGTRTHHLSLACIYRLLRLNLNSKPEFDPVSTSARGVPLDEVAHLPSMPKEAHHGCQDELKRIRSGEHWDRPRSNKFGSGSKGDVQYAKKRSNTAIIC